MKKLSRADENQKMQQKPKPAAITRGTESCNGSKAALSDGDLEQVSAAGDTTVPTMNPEVLLGRHARPDNTTDNKPR